MGKECPAYLAGPVARLRGRLRVRRLAIVARFVLKARLAVLTFCTERRERVEQPRRCRNEQPRPPFNVENVGSVGDLRHHQVIVLAVALSVWGADLASRSILVSCG